MVIQPPAAWDNENRVTLNGSHDNFRFTNWFAHHSFCFTIDQGAITISRIILSPSSSLMSDPPTFTLVGDTSGGPPTTYTWTRNGQVITNNASYSISLQENLDNENVFRESLYRSRLTVTGRLSGVYQYSVTNRATSGMVTDQMTIDFEGILCHA